MSLTLLTAVDYKRVPWANGRGTTLELIRREDAAGALTFRLSVADVVEPGPFSPLPGIDRVITLIDGAGFDLDFDGVQPGETLRPFEPVTFSGDWATSASAVHGPSKDFNVMTARGKVKAEVEAVTAAATFTTGPLAYVYVAHGQLRVSTRDKSVTAASGELICVEGEDALTLDPHPQSISLMVRLMLSQ